MVPALRLALFAIAGLLVTAIGKQWAEHHVKKLPWWITLVGAAAFASAGALIPGSGASGNDNLAPGIVTLDLSTHNGVQCTVDGKPRLPPYEQIWVESGCRHLIQCEAPGYSPQLVVVTPAPGQTIPIHFIFFRIGLAGDITGRLSMGNTEAVPTHVSYVKDEGLFYLWVRWPRSQPIPRGLGVGIWDGTEVVAQGLYPTATLAASFPSQDEDWLFKIPADGLKIKPPPTLYQVALRGCEEECRDQPTLYSVEFPTAAQ